MYCIKCGSKTKNVKIYFDVDVTSDLKKVYEQLKLNETNITNEQKDLLNFLRSNEKIFI